MDPVEPTPDPHSDHGALGAAYGALLGALAVTRSGSAEPLRPSELPALGLATFGLSRLLSGESARAWLRGPSLEEDEHGLRQSGPGLRRAIGELLGCARCVGAWSALGLVGLRRLRPREAEVITAVLATSALGEWLQAGFARLTAGRDTARGPTLRPLPGGRSGDRPRGRWKA